jgi:hypothetical protein
MTLPTNKETGWRIVPDESWRPIVAEYKERIAKIRDLNPWNQTLPDEAFSDTIKKCPFSPSDDPRILTILDSLRLFGGVTASVTVQSVQAICDLWESGHFILVPLNTRFLLESWARVHYAINVTNKLASTRDIDKAEERVGRLTFGTRSEINLPWGGKSSELNSIHINDCLLTLNDVYPDYQADYDFLSESSHPSFFENSYFMIAGPPLANWKNRSYQQTMKPKLNRCFQILESSIVGVIQDANYLLDIYTVVSESISKNETDKA